MDPIDYSAGIPKNYFDNFAQGLQTGMQQVQFKSNEQQRQFQNQLLQNNEARTELQNQQLIQSMRLKDAQEMALAKARSDYVQGMDDLSSNPNATSADYSRLAALASVVHPEYAKNVQEAWKARSEEAKIQARTDLTSVVSQIDAGNIDGAIKTLDSQRAALLMKNDTQGADKVKQLIDSFDSNRDNQPVLSRLADSLVTQGVGMGVFNDKQLDDFVSARNQAIYRAKAKADAVKAGADASTAVLQSKNEPTKIQLNNLAAETKLKEQIAAIGKTEAEVDALYMNAKTRQQELQIKESTLSDSLKDGINKNIVKSFDAANEANKALDLSTRFLNYDPVSGKIAGVSEAYKRFVGNQDEVTAMRKKVDQMVSKMVASTLEGQGSVSNEERSNLTKQFLDGTANPAQVATFLKDYADMNQRLSVFEDAQAEWKSKNKGFLGNATTDFNIGNFTISKGSKFNNFIQNYVREQVAIMQRNANTKQVQDGLNGVYNATSPQSRIGYGTRSPVTMQPTTPPVNDISYQPDSRPSYTD